MKKKVIIVFLVFVFLVIFIIHIPKAKIDIVESYQYITVNTNDSINIELQINSEESIEKDIFILKSKQHKMKINEKKVYKLSDSKYKVVMCINEQELPSGKDEYTQIELIHKGRTIVCPLGSIIIEKEKIIEFKKVNVLATLFSTDGRSFHVIVENNSEKLIEFKELSYELEGTIIKEKLDLTIASGETCETNIKLKMKYWGKNVIIRPVIVYATKNTEFKTLTHQCIYFINQEVVYE